MKDKATTEGDEVQDEVAEQAEAGDAALPEGTTDIQPAKAEDKSNADAAKSTEASKSDEPAGAAENAVSPLSSKVCSFRPLSGHAAWLHYQSALLLGAGECHWVYDMRSKRQMCHRIWHCLHSVML